MDAQLSRCIKKTWRKLHKTLQYIYVSVSLYVVCLTSTDDMRILFPALLFTSFVYVGSIACPEDDSALLNWSDPSSWPGGKVTIALSCLLFLS